MPLYTYKCSNDKCNGYGEEINIQHKIADPTPICKTCGKLSLKKVIKPVRTLFKGDGWMTNEPSGRYHQ